MTYRLIMILALVLSSGCAATDNVSHTPTSQFSNAEAAALKDLVSDPQKVKSLMGLISELEARLARRAEQKKRLVDAIASKLEELQVAQSTARQTHEALTQAAETGDGLEAARQAYRLATAAVNTAQDVHAAAKKALADFEVESSGGGGTPPPQTPAVDESGAAHELPPSAPGD